MIMVIFGIPISPRAECQKRARPAKKELRDLSLRPSVAEMTCSLNQIVSAWPKSIPLSAPWLVVLARDAPQRRPQTIVWRRLQNHCDQAVRHTLYLAGVFRFPEPWSPDRVSPA